MLIGYDSGKELRNGDNNIFLGYEAGLNTNNARLAQTTKTLSSTNIFLGSRAGQQNINGYSNIYIGHDNSKDVINANNGVNDRIYDNISIGTQGSSHGSKTITLGNRTITNNAENSTIIGYDSSYIGVNSLLIGSDIQNTGDNSFILHSKGSITNDSDYYFNINDVFTGYTSNLGGDSYLNFNLDVLHIENKLKANSIEITETFTSKDAVLSNVTVDGLFIAQNKSIFNDESTFNSTLIMSNDVFIPNILSISASDKSVIFYEDTSVTFKKVVKFPKNQTFDEDTIFKCEKVVYSAGTEVTVDGTLKIKKDQFNNYRG
jgi:hypothetical protein